MTVAEHGLGDLNERMADRLPTWIDDHGGLDLLPVGEPSCIAAAPPTSEWEWAVGTGAGRITLHAGDRVATLPGHDQEVRDLDWHPQGHRLASTGDDCVVRVWDLEGQAISSQVVGKRSYLADRVAWHREGQHLAIGGYHGKVEVWQTEALSEVEPTFAIDGHHLAWHPDGTHVLAVSQGTTIVSWDLRQVDKPPLTIVEGAPSSLWRMEWGDGGALLALTDTSDTTTLWDVTTSPPQLFDTLNGAATVAWAPSGSRLVATGPSGTQVGDGRDWGAALVADASGRSVAWRSDGEVVAVSGVYCATLDPDRPAERLGTLPGHTTGIRCLAWSPVEHQPAVDRLAAVGDDEVARIWDRSALELHGGGAEGTTPPQPILLGEPPRPCTSLAWKPDGTRLVTGHWKGGTNIWDPARPEEPLATFEGQTDTVRAVAWSPDGTQIATGAADGTTCVWAVEHPASPMARFPAHREGVDVLAWSPDGNWLATSSSDGTARLWKAADLGRDVPPTESSVLEHGDRIMTTLSWHHESSRLATGSGNTGALVWDLEADAPPKHHALAWGRRGTPQVAWSRDGDLLAASGEDGVVHVGLVGSAPTQEVQSPPTQALAGHTVWARSVAWSWDGGLLATSDTAGIRLWRRDRTQNQVLPNGAILPWAGGRPASGLDAQGGSARTRRDTSGQLLADRPTIDAVLGTDDIAKELNSLIRLRLAAGDGNGNGKTIAVHIDGEWGRGKSTLLAHLRALHGKKPDEDGWLVVTHDAWRHSRISPSWWALTRDLHDALVQELSWPRRWWLAQCERWHRFREAVNTPALVAVIGCLAVLGLSLRWSDGWDENRLQIVSSDLVSSIEGVVTVVVILVAGLALWRRSARWDRRRTADLGRAEHEPVAAAADHVDWLRRRAARPARRRWRARRSDRTIRPILFEVEELDRCPPEVVVEVLETVHTLMRPDKSHGADTEQLAPIAFVVPADRRWIHRAYQVVHHRDQVPTELDLGAHFHSKLFEVVVPLPPISPRRHHALADALCDRLTTPEPSPSAPSGGADARQGGRPLTGEDPDPGDDQPERSHAKRAQDRLASSVLAATPSTKEDLDQKTRHLLRDYAPLLPRNPRSHIRTINDWQIRDKMNEGLPPDERLIDDYLVRWVILSQSWPNLADRLLRLPDLDRPDQVTHEQVVAHLDAVEGELATLLRSWPVRRVWPLLPSDEPGDDRHAVDEGDRRWIEALAKLAGAYPPYVPPDADEV